VEDEYRPLRDSGESVVAGAIEGGARNGVDGKHWFSSVVNPTFDEEQPQSYMEPYSTQGHESNCRSLVAALCRDDSS